MPRVMWVFVFAVFIGLVTPPAGHAQQTRADTAQVLLDVALDLRDRGHDGDADELLRVLARRFADTGAGEEAGRLLAGIRRVGRPGSGTTEFVGWHTTLGALLGVLVPLALDADEPEPYGAGLLVGGSVGYALSRAYTDRHPPTSGQALMIDYASIWGMIQAPAWRDIMDIGDRTECFGNRCFEVDGGGGSEAAILGALTGLGAGVALAANRPVSSGTALSTVFASHWGMWYGAVFGTWAAGELDGDAGLTWVMLGGNAGLLAGIFGAPKLDWSPARVWLVHLSGMAGFVAGFGVALLFDASGAVPVATLLGVSSAVGLGIGVASTTNLRGERVVIPSLGLSVALIQRTDRWRVGIPLPQPVMLPTGRGATLAFERAMRISLLRASW